jgi:hypothetical protein
VSAYAEFTYPALKKECASRGIKATGKRKALVDKLEAADAKAFETEMQTPQGMAKLVAETKITHKLTDPDPDHPGFPNWDYKGRWIRRV